MSAITLIKDPAQATIHYYDEHAGEYFQRTVSADLSPFYDKFLAMIPAGGRILDVGCGSGRDLRAFCARGFRAQGMDASPKLVEMARTYSGAPCVVRRLEDINEERSFEGIWACALLLHLPKGALIKNLLRLHRALTPGGVLFVSVRKGAGEKYESDGRFFAYYKSSELRAAFVQSGFSVQEMWTSEDVLHERTAIRWLNVLATT